MASRSQPEFIAAGTRRERLLLQKMATRRQAAVSRLSPGNVPLSSLKLPTSEEDGVKLDELFRRAPREPHTWTECSGTAFKVRSGPNYKEKRRKKPSAPALYVVFAVDIYKSDAKLPHIGRAAALPDDPPLPAGSGLPPFLIINWMVPDYAPSGMLGPKRSNGPGWNLVLYCRVAPHIRQALAVAHGPSGAVIAQEQGREHAWSPPPSLPHQLPHQLPYQLPHQQTCEGTDAAGGSQPTSQPTPQPTPQPQPSHAQPPSLPPQQQPPVPPMPVLQSAEANSDAARPTPALTALPCTGVGGGGGGGGGAASASLAGGPIPAAAPACPPSALPALDLLRRFMSPGEGGRLRGERLKCILGLADTEKPAFNIVLKAALAHNNFKPFLSKTASFCYVGRVRARPHSPPFGTPRPPRSLLL